MKLDTGNLLSDDGIASAEAAEKIRQFLSTHIAFLTSRLETETGAWERQILEARIDNLKIAQKRLQARLTPPGHA